MSGSPILGRNPLQVFLGKPALKAEVNKFIAGARESERERERERPARFNCEIMARAYVYNIGGVYLRVPRIKRILYSVLKKKKKKVFKCVRV